MSLNMVFYDDICIDEGVQNHPADYTDYDFPDFETERMKILEKWRLFTENSDKDTIYGCH